MPGPHGKGMPGQKPKDAKATFKRILSFVGRSKSLLFVVFFELLYLKLKIIVVPCHARAYAVLLLYICTYLLYQTFLVVYVIHKVKYFGKVLPVCALVGLSYSHCKCVIEIRNGLSAVLVVLI